MILLKIPKVYHTLFEFTKTSSREDRLAFEEEYDVDGVHYMDVYVSMNYASCYEHINEMGG